MIRIGCGLDIHPLVDNRPLILGGVNIPSTMGLLGHSDADALTHAFCDALLGAMSMPNIGQMFPNDNPQYKNIRSINLLAKVKEYIHKLNGKIVNLDASIVLQQPKISPYINQMKKNIAACLEITPYQVGIKATTSENIGFVGRQEGVAVFSVVLLDLPETAQTNEYH